MIRNSIFALLVLGLQNASFSSGNPGLRALVKDSTDVLVVQVESTNPRTAVEGARDTAQLKVLQTLKGSSHHGDIVPLYYHLIFRDVETHELEPPKFIKGGKYTVFLVKRMRYQPIEDVMRPFYELTDDWLGVANEHPAMAWDIAHIVKEQQHVSPPPK